MFGDTVAGLHYKPQLVESHVPLHKRFQLVQRVECRDVVLLQVCRQLIVCDLLLFDSRIITKLPVLLREDIMWLNLRKLVARRKYSRV